MCDVKYAYRNKHQIVEALRGITCEFLPGKFYTVMGKSGSGKSTLLSVIAGLDLPDEGSIIIDGASLSAIDRDMYRLRHCSVVYQSLNLLPLLTVVENVAFPMEYRGKPKHEALRTAREQLASVGIDETKFQRFPSMLSGGEQQRVAIARALAANTDIILADEPTGNLDAENSLAIARMLRELAALKNVCVIVMTHDTAIAELADELLILSDGALV